MVFSSIAGNEESNALCTDYGRILLLKFTPQTINECADANLKRGGKVTVYGDYLPEKDDKVQVWHTTEGTKMTVRSLAVVYITDVGTISAKMPPVAK